MTHSHSSASENHSQSSSCLRNSLTVKPLLQKITHCYPPASYSLSGSISCVTQSLSIIPLCQKHTHSHPPASETHSQLNPCFIHSLSFISCLIFMPLPHTFNQHKSLTAIPLHQKITHSHPPASDSHSASSPCLTVSRGPTRASPAAVTHSHPPASDTHSASFPCLTVSRSPIRASPTAVTHVIPLPQTLTQRHPPASQLLGVIPLPQKITHCHPPVSEIHSQSSPCLTQPLRVNLLCHTATQHQTPTSETH